jgi:hypothetical protein
MEHRFDKHAQHWNLLGSPLRPCAEDMRLMQNCFGNLSHSAADPRRTEAGCGANQLPHSAARTWRGTRS